jgi:tetratricopeptide (TPR) repeat protein
LLGDHEGALFAYEQALRHNQWSPQTLNAISCILRTKEKYPEAMEYLKNILKVEPANGEAWGNLGTFTSPSASVHSLTVHTQAIAT